MPFSGYRCSASFKSTFLSNYYLTCNFSPSLLGWAVVSEVSDSSLSYTTRCNSYVPMDLHVSGLFMLSVTQSSSPEGRSSLLWSYRSGIPDFTLPVKTKAKKVQTTSALPMSFQTWVNVFPSLLFLVYVLSVLLESLANFNFRVALASVTLPNDQTLYLSWVIQFDFLLVGMDIS